MMKDHEILMADHKKIEADHKTIIQQDIEMKKEDKMN
jgi:hypothetical protein